MDSLKEKHVFIHLFWYVAAGGVAGYTYWCENNAWKALTFLLFAIIVRISVVLEITRARHRHTRHALEDEIAKLKQESIMHRWGHDCIDHAQMPKNRDRADYDDRPMPNMPILN